MISNQSLDEVLACARDRVSAVADDPAGRYALCQAFYRRHGFGPGAGYGTSELEFIQWEVTRGVLAPLSAAAPGSPWWRSVNDGLLYHAEAAAALEEAGLGDRASGPIAQWVAYLRAPSSLTWYRAHNSSTVDGYFQNIDAARRENEHERSFMNIVLYRVLYAQALVERDAPGLLGFLASRLHRIIGELESLIANPRSPSVDILLHLPDFYPRHYPLSAQDVADIFRDSLNPDSVAREVLDDAFISPSLTTLYAEAAGWLGMPDLCSLLVDHRPAYPPPVVAV